MTLAACADAVAGEMGLDRQDVREIIERIEKFRKSRKASATLDQDVRAYAQAEGDKARIAAALKRRQAALNILIRDEIDQRLAKVGGSKARAIEAMLVGDARGKFAERQSVAARRVALEAAYGESLAGEIQKDLPHLFALLRRPADAKPLLDDVAREWRNGMDGRTGNQDARQLATVLAKYAEAARLDANRAGANIGQLADWGGPQSYDERRLIKAGQDAFVRDMLAELDIERSFGAGTTADEAAKLLAESWDTITLGRGLAVTGLEKGERLGPANLARSLEAHRVWHFKDADAWIRINDRYGRGNVLTATIDHLHRMARKVSLMQVLGPNPEVMLNSVLEEQRGKVRTGSKSKGELDELNANLATGSGRIGRAFREVMGDTFVPENLKVAQIAAGIRGVETMAKLGGSVISSITDLATYAHALRIQGHGLFTGYAKALAGLFNGRSKAETQQLQQLLGTGFDAWLGAVHGRFAADDALPGRIANAQRVFFKLNGQQWWDRNLRTSFMAMTAAEMRQHAHMGFDALPDAYRHFLGLHGVDAARWEAIRATAPEAGMIVPERIGDLPDEAIAPLVAGKVTDEKLAKARRDLELQLRGLLHDESGFGIITPDDRTRANILQGTAPGSVRGEAFRFFMQFKSFSFAYMQKALGSNRGAGGRDWGAMAALIGMSTVLGYGAMTIKDMVKNKTPKDPTDIKTIIAAMLQGGGLGLYGDFLFSKSDRFGASPLADIAGPTASTAESTVKALWNWTSPDKTLDKKMQAGGSDLFWLGLNNTPYLNLFYTRAVLDLAVLNWLQERMTPGTFRRREKNMERDFGQRYIVPPLALTGP